MKRWRYVPSGIVRWVFNRPCSETFCKERRRCWRWHVEFFTCPTCGTEVSEFDRERRTRVLMAIMHKGRPFGGLRPMDRQPDRGGVHLIHNPLTGSTAPAPPTNQGSPQ